MADDLRDSAAWCRNAAQLVMDVVRVTPDRDGDHPQQVTCVCGATVTPILLVARTGWYFPAHPEQNGRGDTPT